MLFVNAGMNQFKDVFTGRRAVDYARATSVQKCIRAGGKHNDLDNVGFTARHHTFFEMLGNFSFGDYFKERAIAYAWEWVTNELSLPIDRLWATVYTDDDEAFELWAAIAPELKRGGRILRFGKADNYWSMGDIGPCGPCSELHIDRGEQYGVGPEHVVNGETDRFMEIWNLVFMQDDQSGDGATAPLPKPSVDTGAGLERLAAVLQQVDTNYEIDLFTDLVEALCDIAHSSYDKHRASHHVIVDHIRALSFSLADGAGISNEGRGYVLRRILRRAARHGRLLGQHEPFIYRLVPALVATMGEAYPELRDKQPHVEAVIRTEEESFHRTLETGLELFDRVASKLAATGATTVPGDEVFRLYDTYGFPYDLTEIIARERGLDLDRPGFEAAMSAQQERSRAGASFGVASSSATAIVDNDPPAFAPTEFVRDVMSVDATIQRVAPIDGTDTIAVVLDRTPFYVESGGQISDTGTLEIESATMTVSSMAKSNDYVVHIGTVTSGSSNTLTAGVTVRASIDVVRRWDVMRNHTATHLLHKALRSVLGDHVRQSGSYVGPDRLRFDFSHHGPISADDLVRIEEIVNGEIIKGTAVATEIMSLDAAKASGAMALFGEKYDDNVRVVMIDGFSRELCGGTHVATIGQIGPFVITLETGVASGVRRIEAITGRAAQDYVVEVRRFRRDVAATVNRPEADAIGGVKALAEANKSLQRDLKKAREELVSGGGSAPLGSASDLGPLTLMTHDFGESDRDTLAAWIDAQKSRPESVVAIALGTVAGKVTYMAAATSAATDHAVHIGSMTKELLPQFGGRGGGKPNFAQGTVAADTVASDLFATAEAILRSTTEGVHG